MRTAADRRPRLELEQLEQRCLLAGNVTATVVCGNLFVVGDSQANDISIYQTTAGTIKVVGNFDTTVNSSGNPFETTCAVDDVIVSMGGGNDGVNMTLVVNGNLTVLAG